MLNQDPSFNRMNERGHSKDYVAMSVETVLRKSGVDIV